MVTFEEIAQKSGLRLVRSLGKKEQTLWLAETADGERRILRRYAGADVPCRALVGSEAPQLPQVYACCDADGDTVSEEEYIDGTLLSELLRRALLNEAQAAAIARELCLGLKTLHSLGFVHRDVKPENVMLTRQGRVVLLDLDAAAPVLGTPDTNTRLLGTAGYAAPEQFGFARCDVRADIFALGVLLNVALTGEHPAVRLAEGRLGRIVRRCTNTNAAQRYANIDALLRQLPPAAHSAHRAHNASTAAIRPAARAGFRAATPPHQTHPPPGVLPPQSAHRCTGPEGGSWLKSASTFA